MKNMKQSLDHHIVGVTTVGERGQIVIPKNIRDQLKINKGSQFLMIFNSEGLMLVTLESMKKMSDHLSKEIKKVNKIIKKN
jgi:AbrB family looped-hinge helix DNA binding protein